MSKKSDVQDNKLNNSENRVNVIRKASGVSENINESINRSLDEAKDNINRSIDESRTQIPYYNEIVNNYQEQSLQTAKEISENYIESQKEIINSIESAWKPQNEIYNQVIGRLTSPDTLTKTYSRIVSNIVDNTVASMRLFNSMLFANMDSWKSALQQTGDNSKQLFNLATNTARTIEQNSRELTAIVTEPNTNSSTAYSTLPTSNANISPSNTTSSSHSKTK